MVLNKLKNKDTLPKMCVAVSLSMVLIGNPSP